MSFEPINLPIVQKAIDHQQDLAIVDATGNYSYNQLLDRAKRVASNLLSEKPDLDEARVAFIVPSSCDYVAILLGIWMAGGVAVPLCNAHPKPELEYVVENSEASILVAHADFEDLLSSSKEPNNLQHFNLEEIFVGEPGKLPVVDPGRRAMILYTSGTTGKPKGVVTTHKIIASQITTLIDAWEWQSSDYTVNVLPLHHVHGIVNVLCCSLWAGATCEMQPHFDPEEVWNSFQDRSTVFMAVPTVYVRMIKYWEEKSEDEQKKLSESCKNLRLTVSGSAALPVKVFDRWKEISGHYFLERYGMTEIGMALSNPYWGERRSGHVGKALRGVNVRLVDDEGHEIAGEACVGEIQVQSSSVFLEYWKKPEETKEAFAGDWFCTGDMARVEKGHYRILGRNSVDIIKSGGYKISALEIEDTLRTHPAIQDCAVVGLDDDEWGEQVAAAIQLKDEQAVTSQELRDWGKMQLAVYKVPKIVQLVDSLPRNVMGKVCKPDVKELFQ